MENDFKALKKAFTEEGIEFFRISEWETRSYSPRIGARRTSGEYCHKYRTVKNSSSVAGRGSATSMKRITQAIKESFSSNPMHQ